MDKKIIIHKSRIIATAMPLGPSTFDGKGWCDGITGNIATAGTDPGSP